MVTASFDWLLVGAHPPQRPALFVCTDNAARSMLAAAMWTERTGLPAESMGLRPAGWIHPETVAAASRAGLDLGSVAPRRVERMRLVDRNVQVITVCDRAHEQMGQNEQWWHWSIPDPVEVGTPEAFDTVVAELDARLRELVG